MTVYDRTGGSLAHAKYELGAVLTATEDSTDVEGLARTLADLCDLTTFAIGVAAAVRQRLLDAHRERDAPGAARRNGGMTARVPPPFDVFARLEAERDAARAEVSQLKAGARVRTADDGVVVTFPDAEVCGEKVPAAVVLVIDQALVDALVGHYRARRAPT